MRSAVLFLVFNRPDTTRQVFEAIRKAQPPRLYVAADGPRLDKAGELEKCEEVRRIAMAVDWSCEVKTLFREKNLGCKIGVSSGIDWFFENEGEGIILEDDCLPSESFFLFCDDLLLKYRHDSRIWQISGTLYFPEAVTDVEGDYFFSQYGPIWGWASWRRAWKNYDVNMNGWLLMSNPSIMNNVYFDENERNFKKRLGNMLFEGKIDTWDYQWGFTKNYNHALTIVPKKNLIKNIGFGRDDATHTTGVNYDAPSEFGDFKGDINHPFFIVRNCAYDYRYASRIFLKNRLINRLFRRLSNVLKKIKNNYKFL